VGAAIRLVLKRSTSNSQRSKPSVFTINDVTNYWVAEKENLQHKDECPNRWANNCAKMELNVSIGCGARTLCNLEIPGMGVKFEAFPIYVCQSHAIPFQIWGVQI